jgi:hypothetical protein
MGRRGTILMNKELQIFGMSIRVSFMAFALIATIIVFSLGFYPYLANMETRGTRQTLQYITTHQTALRTIYTQYQDRTQDAAHRRAMFNQLQLEADKIPNDVPSDIRASLSAGFQE